MSDENISGLSNPEYISGKPEKKEEEPQPTAENNPTSTTRQKPSQTDEPSEPVPPKSKRLPAPSDLRSTKNDNDGIVVAWNKVKGAKSYTVEFAESRDLVAKRSTIQREITQNEFAIKPTSEERHSFIVYAVNENNEVGEPTPVLEIKPALKAADKKTSATTSDNFAEDTPNKERAEQDTGNRKSSWSTIATYVAIGLLIVAALFVVYSNYTNKDSANGVVVDDSEVIGESKVPTTTSRATSQQQQNGYGTPNVHIYNYNQIGTGLDRIESTHFSQDSFATRLNKPINVRELREKQAEIITNEPAYIELPPDGTKVLVLREGRGVHVDLSEINRFTYHTELQQKTVRGDPNRRNAETDGRIIFKSLDPSREIKIWLRFEDLP